MIQACCTREFMPVEYALIGVPRSCAESHPNVPLEAIHLIGKTWQSGETITIGFMDGSPTQRKACQRLAEEWLQYANLKFKWSTTNDPDVRVSFGSGGPGSYSIIGNDVRRIKNNQCTMNFGWVTDTSDEETNRAVIVHEFGHMLALGHEQSSPNEDIQWNKPVALAWYMRTQGWTADMVIANVFSVYAANQVVATAYDRNSIMQYPVDPSLTLDGRGIGWNTDLTPTDIQHIGQMYPGAQAPPTSPPTSPPTPPVSRPPQPISTSTAVPIKPDGTLSLAPIPRPGDAAEFDLIITEAGIYSLYCSVNEAKGLSPICVLDSSNGRLVVPHLTRGRSPVALPADHYQVQIYNPFPRLAGTALVSVTPPS